MDGTSLRQRSKMLTSAEAAAATSLPIWKIERQITLGAIAFNKLGDGTLVLHEVDIWKLTDVDDAPATYRGWFDTSKLLDIRDFGSRADSSGLSIQQFFAKEFLRSGYTVGQTVLRHSAYQFARYHLRNGSKRYGFSVGSSSLEHLYGVGPDHWRNFATDCKVKLENLTFAMHGQRYGFRSCARAGYSELCKRVIREAF